ncbi:MAG: methyl-accepting chemotaxis protein [Thermoplasmata archaeon]|nr:methyl-accepting chemotaxis protein [Thermoplasmata archaeon]
MVEIGLRGKLMVIFLAVCLIPVGAIALVSMNNLNSLNNQSQILYSHNLKAIETLDEMKGYMIAVHLPFNDYILKGYLNRSITTLQQDIQDMNSAGLLFGSALGTYQRNYTLSEDDILRDMLQRHGEASLVTLETTYLGQVVSYWGIYETKRKACMNLANLPTTGLTPSDIQNRTNDVFQLAYDASNNYSACADSLEQIIGIRTEVAQIANEEADDLFRVTIFGIIAGVGVIVLAIIFAAYYISRKTTEPIVAMAKIANDIQKGNLSPEIDLKETPDEIGEMVVSFKKMVDTTFAPIYRLKETAETVAMGDLSKDLALEAKGDIQRLVVSFEMMLNSLRSLVMDVRETSSLVSSTSDNLASISEEMNATTEEVSTAIQKIAAGAQHQAERIKEAVKIVGDQLTSVEQVVSSAESAADASTKASEVAQRGGDSAQVALQKMREIQAVVDGATEIVRKLGERTKEIHQIVNVITNIAQQTNLLALNAAIEAARAGEHGRGFAVVADEVRKLAEGSGRAASQISVLVDQIETETRKAVDQMENGAKDVSLGASVIDSALASLEDIAATIEETAAMVEEITASTEEQKASAEKIVRAVDEVAKIAEDTSAASEETAISTESLTASMEEMTASAQELARLSGLMQGSVEKFILPPPEILKKEKMLAETELTRIQADEEKAARPQQEKKIKKKDKEKEEKRTKLMKFGKREKDKKKKEPKHKKLEEEAPESEE